MWYRMVKLWWDEYLTWGRCVYWYFTVIVIIIFYPVDRKTCSFVMLLLESCVVVSYYMIITLSRELKYIARWLRNVFLKWHDNTWKNLRYEDYYKVCILLRLYFIVLLLTKTWCDGLFFIPGAEWNTFWWKCILPYRGSCVADLRFWSLIICLFLLYLVFNYIVFTIFCIFW